MREPGGGPGKAAEPGCTALPTQERNTPRPSAGTRPELPEPKPTAKVFGEIGDPSMGRAVGLCAWQVSRREAPLRGV